MTTTARNAQTAALEALIEAHAIELKLPTVRRRYRALALFAGEVGRGERVTVITTRPDTQYGAPVTSP